MIILWVVGSNFSQRVSSWGGLSASGQRASWRGTLSLLLGRDWGHLLRSIDLTEKRVNHFTGMKEVEERPDRDGARLSVIGRRNLSCLDGTHIQIGPCRGNKRTASIWKNQGQEQVAISVQPTEQLQGLALQRVMMTQDGYLGGETLDVGSIS